jgi:hypothetical protein
MTDLIINFNHMKRMTKEYRTLVFILKSTLSRIWGVVSMLLSDEPHIWQGRDQSSSIWWYVYNPISGRSIQLPSEQEVWQWLE